MLAQQALDKAESIDGYRAACEASPLNAAARADHTYAPSFLEKADLDRLHRNIYDVPLMKTADIIILHPSADNGYPHTRPNAIICMPKSAVLGMSSDTLTETLCHEAIHIHQRRNPELWAAACSGEGWTPTARSELPPEFVERCRINPDTFSRQQFWAWQTHYVPMPLFTRDDYPTLAGVQIKWLDKRNMALFPDPPPSFVKRYGAAPSQPEHPYELLAVEYAAAKLNTDDSLRTKLRSF